MERFFTSILFLIATALLGGCGGGETAGGTGVLAVQITDAKVDEAQAVVLLKFSSRKNTFLLNSVIYPTIKRFQ